MRSTQEKLLRLLADAELHSGTELATQLGLTRAAVWKNVRQLEDLGLEVQAVKAKGYRLTQPVELLDGELIGATLPHAARQQLESIDVLWQTASTSDYLMQQPPATPDHGRVCLAEFQTGGRGRRGRQWFASAGHGICLSLAWNFRTSPQPLSCLGLAAGIGVLRAVRAAGAGTAMLKWPNDVVIDGQKLAGILVDVQGETGGPMQAVVGVGVNYRLPRLAAQQVEAAGGLPPACLESPGHAAALPRNATVAALINELQQVMTEFAARGFSIFVPAWREADCLRGKTISVATDKETITGVARGIAADGRLQLETKTGITHLATGDVTLRATEQSGS